MSTGKLFRLRHLSAVALAEEEGFGGTGSSPGVSCGRTVGEAEFLRHPALVGYSSGNRSCLEARWARLSIQPLLLPAAVVNHSGGPRGIESGIRERKHAQKPNNSQGEPLGVNEAITLLQTVSHGTTEYSVVFLANERRILVAVDNLQTDMWDAPYMKWTEFSFDELFRR